MLRDMLENAGLSLSDSDVSEQRDSQADADERGPGSSHREATSPDTEDVSVTTVLSVTVDPDRLVDTYIWPSLNFTHFTSDVPEIWSYLDWDTGLSVTMS